MNRIVALFLVFFLCVPAFAGAQSPTPTALERSIQADAAHARLAAQVERLAAEVEKLRSNPSSTSANQEGNRVILARLDKLTEQLNGTNQAGELDALRASIQELRNEVATQATAISSVETSTNTQITELRRRIERSSSSTASGVDSIARQATALAICLAGLALFIGILARRSAKKSHGVVRDVVEELETVRRTQRGQAHDINELKKRVEPVVFPDDFAKCIHALTGQETYSPVIELDGEKFVVEFKVAEDSPGMLRVYGIRGHHNPIQRKNAKGVVARAALNFRLTQTHRSENNPGGDNVVVIGTVKK